MQLILLFLSWILYFNSIKVQLEPEVRVFPEFFIRFQFHKGTIRTDFG